MKKRIKNINRDILKRKKFLNKEIKKLILKSIFQNLNLKPIIRAKSLKRICELSRNASISKQKNNMCLLTGRGRGVINLTNTSRHKIKEMSRIGGVQNLKIKSW